MCNLSTFFVGIVVFVSGVHAEHLSGGRGQQGFLKAFDAAHFRDELHQAVFDALGLDHGLDLTGLGSVREELKPLWASLAKNAYGSVDRRSLRYALHRYFMKVHSISIIGLEPLHRQGTTNPEAGLVMQFAPRYVKQMLHEGDEKDQGYTINDAVAMIAMLRELVVHQNVVKSEELYADRGWDSDVSFNRTFASTVAMDHLIRWLVGYDARMLRSLDGNPRVQKRHFEFYDDLLGFAEGMVRSFEVARGVKKLDGFTMQDMQVITSGMVLSFGSFWHTECMRMKDMLVEMDPNSIGRVKLSDFHGSALDGEWRFSESSDYLRVTGALDETSPAIGPRVILSNYLQGASNCIVTQEHYRVCCANECEDHMTEIEASVQRPDATPEQLLKILAGMTTNLDDGAPRVTPALEAQLREIAGMHHGTVPIHGRLFAQWLHYVLPQDCPFPYKVGAAKSMSVDEFGGGTRATESEMIANQQLQPESESEDDAEWMSQWSEEEDLLSEHIHLHAPWERRWPLFSKVSLATCASAVGIVVLGAQRLFGTGKGTACDLHSKQHFV